MPRPAAQPSTCSAPLPGAARPPARPCQLPAVLAIAALGGGLWLGSSPTWGLATLSAAAVGGLWACRSTRSRLACLGALFLLAAAGWRGAGDAPLLLPDPARACLAFRGRVAADPRVSDSGHRLTVDLTGRWQDGAWLPVDGRVQLSVRGRPEPPPARGDAVVFDGPLYPAQGFRNPGSGGYAAYLNREGIVARATARWPGEVLFAPPAPGELPALQWRNRASRKIAAAAPGTEGAVLRALALGDRSGLMPATTEAFRRTGTAHVLAISGLHLGILALLLVPALRWLLGRVPGLALRCPLAPLARLLAVPILVAYAALSGFQTSTLRALAMVILLLAGTALSRPVSRSGLLAATALVLALWHPPVLTDPGFQLSLAALGALFWLAPAMEAVLPGRRDDPLAALEHSLVTGSGVLHRGRRLAGRAALGLTRWTLYSTAAAAATTPLAVFHFGAGSLAGAVLSPVVIAALGFLCLPLTLGGLLLHPVLPELAVWLWEFAGVPAGWVGHLLKQTAPHAPVVGWQFLRTPEGLLGAFALLASATLALGKPRRSPRRSALVLTLAAVGTVLAVVPATVRAGLARLDPALHLWVLDVGQGQAVALRAPGGRWCLVDGGGFPTSPFDVGARVVVPAMEHLGASRLDLAVSTHPHPDHLGGMASAVAWGRPREVWLPGSFRGDPRYAPLLSISQDVGARVVWVGSEGHRGLLGGSAVAARWVSAPGENDRSMLLRAGPPGAQALIAADLEIEGQQLLMASGGGEPCAVLVAPHHGAESSLHRPFLAATAPAAVIVSASGRRGLPSPRFLDSARELGAEVFGTHQLGCLHARLEPDGRVAVQAAPR